MKFGRMKSQRRNRLLQVVFLVVTLGAGVGLVMMALQQNINLFYSPEEVVNGTAPTGKFIRVGGMVLEGSVLRSDVDLNISFTVSDMGSSEFKIQYEGILPDLFREGQGVIAEGVLNQQGVFTAVEVLAKHDENYMPPEVADVIASAHRDNEVGVGNPN